MISSLMDAQASSVLRPWPLAASAVALGALAGVSAWGAVRASSQIFGPVVWRTARPREIALTFDDGPNPAATPQLLELLHRHAVPATFFVVGRFVKSCPELVREIAARGHAIGNHTDTHPNLVWLLPSQIETELRRCSESIADALGPGSSAFCNWMRPPFGFRGPQLGSAVRRCGLRGVATWSLKCYDWKPQPLERLVKRLGKINERAGMHAASRGGIGSPNRGGEIVLLHDGDFRRLGADRSHVLAALKYWLPRWRDAGLRFVTMDEATGTTG